MGLWSILCLKARRHTSSSVTQWLHTAKERAVGDGGKEGRNREAGEELHPALI